MYKYLNKMILLYLYKFHNVHLILSGMILSNIINVINIKYIIILPNGYPLLYFCSDVNMDVKRTCIVLV